MKRRTFLMNAAICISPLPAFAAKGRMQHKPNHSKTSMSISSLNTPDENSVESLAMKLIHSPQVKKQKEECRQRLLADPVAATADGKGTLDQALEDLAFAAALGGANSDPTRPKITWTLAAPRKSFGHTVPGSRYLIDNPDTVYRFTTVDGDSRYEITVRTRQPGPAQFSFMLHDTMFSENSKKSLADQDQPIAGLRDLDIRTNPDGSFKVTVDSEAANGRINHLQTNPDARIIWIRNSLDQWGKQIPHEISIERVGGPPIAERMTEADMATHAAEILKGGTDWLLALMNKTFAHVGRPNAVSKLFGRGGAWGYAARGNFRLADDEALLVVLAPPVPQRYVGFQLTDLWQVSREYVEASGSLNNTQAEANSDGSYTYVVAVRDPGVLNWLDTGGLHEGGLLIRWQALAERPNAHDEAIRDVRLVKLNELARLLPVETTRVTPERRQALCQQRARSYAHRYTG